MGEATAKVTFTLENADEVLSLLREMKRFLDGGGAPGGGTPSGPSAPGTAPGSGTAAPPVGNAPTNPVTANPGANPAAMPQNTPIIATAGASGSPFGYFNPQTGGFGSLMYDPTVGRFFDPSNGSYMLGGAGFGFGGGGGKAAVPPDPSGGNMLSALGAIGLGHHAAQVAGQMAGAWATSSVEGQVFRPERLIPGLTTLGLMGAGALIGGAATSWSGPGALIGAGIGAAVAGIGGEAMKPIIEHNIKLDELNRLQRGLGSTLTTEPGTDLSWLDIGRLVVTPYAAPDIMERIMRKVMAGEMPSMPWDAPKHPNDMIEARMKGLSSGRYLGEPTYSSIEAAYPDSPIRRGIETNALERARYGKGNIIRLGVPDENEDLTLSQKRDILLGDAYGNELETAAALKNMGLKKQAKKVLDSYESRIRLESEMEGDSAELGLAEFQFSRAGRYGGSVAARSASGAYQAKAKEQAANLRQQAQLLEKSDPGKARALRAQASQLEISTDDAIADTVFGLRMEEASARAGLETGRANRAFDTALYSGASAESLPWEQKANAMRRQASELEALMAERGDRLSPADRARMTEEIENLRFQADLGIGRAREQAVNSEKIAKMGLETAQERTREMPGILRGSAIEQTREYDLQKDALERQQRTLEQILQTSRYLTAEQKIQIQTQIEGLKVEQDRLKIAGGIAKASARYMTSETQSVEGSVDPTIALIRGAGGAQATESNLALLGLTEKNIAAKRAQIDELRALGLDEDSPEIQKARREIAGMTIQREQQQRNLAVVPMSAGDRATRSNLQTQLAFYQQGYGSFGDIRGNLLGQVKMSERRIDELAKNRETLKKQGRWTEAMEADFVEARNAAAMEGLQAAEAYSFGWDQRLISEAYNMPSQGRLFMSRFTRREAAAAGIFHRSFGGSEEQTRHAREMYPQFARMLGSGDPRNFKDAALASSDSHGRAGIDVRIKLETSGDLKVRETSYQVTNGKTTQDANVNVAQQKRAKA